LQLQKNGVDKFVVDNNGNIITGGANDPNAVKINPSTPQTIQPTGDFTPLTLKAGTGSPVAPLFNILDNSGGAIVEVSPSGNLLVGNPANKFGKVSVGETGTGNYGGYFEINNASNPNPAVYGYTSGTGKAGYFWIDNTSNSNNAVHCGTTGTGKAGVFEIINTSNTNSIIFGNTTGTGPLLQLQKNGVDKFVVDNNGNTTIAGNAVPVTYGATHQLIQSGQATEVNVGDQFIDITFPTPFSSPPIMVANVIKGSQLTFGFVVPENITNTGCRLNIISGDAAYIEQVHWIAIGNK
jgi:hypothetical protein